jgi:Flp pilus assembly protein TadG
MTIEMALVSIPFFSLIVGVIGIAYVVFTYNSVAFMAQQGGRWASIHGSASGAQATSADVTSYVMSQAAGLAPGAVAVNTTWTPNASPGSTVKVDVVYSITDALASVVPVPISFHCSSTVTIIR